MKAKKEKNVKRRKAGFFANRSLMFDRPIGKKVLPMTSVENEGRVGCTKATKLVNKYGKTKAKKRLKESKHFFSALTRKGSTEVLSNQRLPSFCNRTQQR
jgi:hypothetical protein